MGTVYLVGAGPGDPGLLTVKAARLLRRADIVFHDALVNPRILDLAPARAERIDAGKRHGKRSVSQEHTNQLLIEAAALFPVVVRLKGGDPLIFGRGGEEALALRAAGVRFRIVPGITAALGAAAYAGIPLTHRDVASTLTIVTGYESVHRPDSEIAWEQMAGGSGTVVVYMGVTRLREIASRLIGGGRSPQTPVAVIENATWPEQRTVYAQLSNIAAEAERAGIGSPALIIIGEVAGLGKQLNWYENKGIAAGRARLELRS
ncbi:MAG: uroporphyrinogen-III C-methyltransferase [Gemmatimonadota bacterium]